MPRLVLGCSWRCALALIAAMVFHSALRTVAQDLSISRHTSRAHSPQSSADGGIAGSLVPHIITRAVVVDVNNPGLGIVTADIPLPGGVALENLSSVYWEAINLQMSATGTGQKSCDLELSLLSGGTVVASLAGDGYNTSGTFTAVVRSVNFNPGVLTGVADAIRVTITNELPAGASGSISGRAVGFHAGNIAKIHFIYGGYGFRSITGMTAQSVSNTGATPWQSATFSSPITARAAKLISGWFFGFSFQGNGSFNIEQQLILDDGSFLPLDDAYSPSIGASPPESEQRVNHSASLLLDNVQRGMLLNRSITGWRWRMTTNGSGSFTATPPATLYVVVFPEALPATDLVLNSALASPTALVGQALSVNWIASNRGTEPTWLSSWTDRVTISDDPVFGMGVARTLGEFAYSTGALLPAATYAGTASGLLSGADHGQRYLFLTLDATTRIYETDESNNVFGPIPISILNPPDLAVQDVVAPPSATFGQPITVSWQTQNVGEVATGHAWQYGVYISTSAGLAGATRIGTLPGPNPLGAGGNESPNSSFVLPTDFDNSGTRYIVVRADDSLAITEELERSNNTAASSALTLTPTPSANLTVTNPDAPSAAVAGASIQLSWTVENIGTAPATGSWIDRIIAAPSGGTPRVIAEFLHNGPLAAGGRYDEVRTVTLPVDLEGVVRFEFRTDATNVVPEPAAGAESDNAAYTPFDSTVTLPPGPDLVIAEVSPSVGSSQFGAPLSITWRGRNNGNRDAQVAWSDRVFLSRDALLSADDVPLEPAVVAPTIPLPADQEYSSGATVTPPVSSTLGNDQYYFIVRADAGGSVSEQREGNNTRASGPVTLTRPPLPNLQIVELSQPAPAAPLSLFDVTWRTTNAGGAPVSGSWIERVYVSSDSNIGGDTAVASYAASESLAVGGTSAPRTRTIQVPSGGLLYRVVVCIEAPLALLEESTTDNCTINAADATIRRPDLLVSGVSATPDPVLADGQLTVSWSTTNAGALPTSATVIESVSITALDPPNTTYLLGSAFHDQVLGVGQSIPTIATFAVPGRIAGAFRVVVRTDIADSSLETDEANNAATGNTITVVQPPRPDLRVTSIAPPSGGLVGAAGSVEWHVANDGPAQAGPAWLDRVIARRADGTGGDLVLAIVPHSTPLPAGEEYAGSANVSLPTAAGDYIICVTTDSGDVINEGLTAGETNNTLCTSASFSTTGYDVFAGASVSEALAGTPVTISGQVTRTDNGALVPDAGIAIEVRVRGTSRVFPTSGVLRSDANGQYDFTLPLLSGEAGQYVIRTGLPGVIAPLDRAQFTLHGMRAPAALEAVRVYPGGAVVERVFDIVNTGDAPLTSLAVDTANGPAGLDVQTIFDAAPLSGQQARRVTLRLSAPAGTADATGTLHIDATTAQGTGTTTTLPIQIAPPDARLVANPAPLSAAMLVPAQDGDPPIQTNVEFTLMNTGGQPTGPIQITLPAAAWLQLGSPAQLPSLDPGQQTAVIVTLTPGRELLVGTARYSGQIAVNSQRASVPIPFEFTAISDGVGSLLLRAEDERTFYDAASNFPAIAGASVRVLGADGVTLLASGLTALDGFALFEQLPEGDLYVEVSAPQHQSYRALATIRRGQTTELFPFLAFNAVTYSWNVDPVQIEDQYRFTLEATFETNVPFPIVDIEPRVVDLYDVGDAPYQVNFRLTNRGLVSATDVALAVAGTVRWDVSALQTQIGTLPPGDANAVTVPVIFTRRPPCDNCDSLGGPCSSPQVSASNVVHCRTDITQSTGVAVRGAAAASCGSTGTGTGGGGGGSPASGDTSNAAAVLRTPAGGGAISTPPCRCIEVAVIFFTGYVPTREIWGDSGGVNPNFIHVGSELTADFPGRVAATTIAQTCCGSEARQRAKDWLRTLNPAGCDPPKVILVGHSLGGDAVESAGDIPNRFYAITIDPINRRAAFPFQISCDIQQPCDDSPQYPCFSLTCEEEPNDGWRLISANLNQRNCTITPVSPMRVDENFLALNATCFSSRVRFPIPLFCARVPVEPGDNCAYFLGHHVAGAVEHGLFTNHGDAAGDSSETQPWRNAVRQAVERALR